MTSWRSASIRCSGGRDERSAAQGVGTARTGRTWQETTSRRDVRAKRPRFLEALGADLRIALACRSERYRFRGRIDAAVQIVRLMVVSDAFLAQVCSEGALAGSGCSLVAQRVFHRLAIVIAQVSIGDPVVIRPGVYIAHGQTIIDGFTEIHRGVIIAPWTSIGLVTGLTAARSSDAACRSAPARRCSDPSSCAKVRASARTPSSCATS